MKRLIANIEANYFRGLICFLFLCSLVVLVNRLHRDAAARRPEYVTVIKHRAAP